MRAWLIKIIYKHEWLMRLLRIHSPSKHMMYLCWCNKNLCYWSHEESDAACYHIGLCGCKVILPQYFK